MKPIEIFWGKVVTGQKRGKDLGFPTANIRLHKEIPEGVYSSLLYIHSSPFLLAKDQDVGLPSATFIGSAKTFNEKDYKAESFILNFNKNIYDTWVTVHLFKKLRGNKKFTSKEELIDQMKKDVEIISNSFKGIKIPH